MVQRKAQDGKPRTATSTLTQLLNYDEVFFENSAFYSCDVVTVWSRLRGTSRGLSTLATQLNAGMQRSVPEHVHRPPPSGVNVRRCSATAPQQRMRSSPQPPTQARLFVSAHESHSLWSTRTTRAACFG